MSNCAHKWKRFEPKVTHWNDGYNNLVTLTHTHWCELCYQVKETSQNYIETTITWED